MLSHQCIIVKVAPPNMLSMAHLIPRSYNVLKSNVYQYPIPTVSGVYKDHSNLW